MSPPPAAIDTNVVVSGLLTADPASPTARILDGMLDGRFPYLLSIVLVSGDALLRQSSRVLRPREFIILFEA